MDVGAGMLPPSLVLRQRLRYHPDPADRHAAGDRCADNVEVITHSYAPVSPVACDSAKPSRSGRRSRASRSGSQEVSRFPGQRIPPGIRLRWTRRSPPTKSGTRGLPKAAGFTR